MHVRMLTGTLVHLQVCAHAGVEACYYFVLLQVASSCRTKVGCRAAGSEQSHCHEGGGVSSYAADVAPALHECG